MRARFAPCFALAILIAAPAMAQVAPSSIDIASLKQGEYRVDAMQLARTTMPAAGFRGMLEASLVNGFRLGAKDSLGEMDKNSPGIVAELETAIVKAASPHIDRMHQDMVERYARLFSRTLNASEVRQLMAFYQTPLGRKIINRKYAHLSTSDALEGLIDKERMDAQDVNSVNRKVASSLVGEMTPDDLKAITALMQTPVFKKMQQLTGPINELEAAAGNEPDRAFDDAVSQAVDAVLERRKLN